MEDDQEWNFPEPGDRQVVPPEQQDRFRRLLTEVVFSSLGAAVFGLASALIRPPVRISTSWAKVPPPPQWEIVLYEWLPLALFGIAFVCLVWLVTVLMRIGELKKERS
ncbi:hypothetical protein [Luteolibacter soli]|uniref:Uncharacterized protein n=1 Tax=Luteolibacter soli TaxID=3135280 RepID=A0ABU9B1A7_9BACT